MNRSMTIWNWPGESRTRPGTFVMPDDEAFPHTQIESGRQVGLRMDDRATYSGFQNIWARKLWNKVLSGDQDGYKCGLLFFARREREHTNDDSAESVAGQVGAEGQRKVSTVSQGETRQVSERQHASDVVVAVEAARPTRSSAMLCVKDVAAVALEEMAEGRKNGWPWQTREMRGWPCCARVEPAIVPKP